MRVGLYDVDSKNFPNLALMKISAYHKSRGDNVEFINLFQKYDKVYVSKIFGDEYSQIDLTAIQCDDIVYGGTGFALTIQNGKEVYAKANDKPLPQEIENMYPDYSLYPELTKDTAYGFLTRGCCNNCDFCIVSKKEGLCSKKVANLSQFWNGQKHIKLLDPNLLACKDRIELLKQLADSNAWVDFTQGLDARFINDEVCELLKKIKVKRYHFAFDFTKNEEVIMEGLECFTKNIKTAKNQCYVYVLTNFNTTFEEDFRRIKLIESVGLAPDVRIYRKNTAPKIIKDLQRWCNNRIIYRTQPDFYKYVPRKDGKTIQEIYFKE